MRVHPIAPRKRNPNFRYDGNKKLRRLPHIFSKVLELPLPFDADVAVSEGPTWLRFAAAGEGFFFGGGVRAHAVEIHPGVMKVIVRDIDDVAEDVEVEMALDRWRFRLPSGTQPRLATAEYADGELVVIVPKGVDEDDDDVAYGSMLLVQ